MMLKVIFCLSFCFSAALAIDCYSCLTGCGDPFTATDEDTCTGETCVKTSSEIGSVKSVVRSCSATKQTGGCTTASLLGISSTTCYCSANKCNGQTGLHATGVVGSILFAILSALYVNYAY